MNGWGSALNTVAAPNELTLTRARLSLPSDAPAVFTVTLVGAGEPSREARVWATVMREDIPRAYYDLVTAALEGDADWIKLILESAPELINSTDEDGVPLFDCCGDLGACGGGERFGDIRI